MTTFLKGDTTAAITLALADGFDYSGKTVNLEYQGVRRTFTGCVAGGALTFAFAAEETAPMSLGAYPVRVWIEGGGEVMTVHNADVKLRVTDCIADVHGGGAIYLDVHGGLHGIEGLPERFTDEDLRSKVNEIVRRLGGAVAIAVLALLPAFGSTVDVLTAPKGVIYNDQQVVTNVTVDVSDKADKTDTYTKDETDAKIVELAPQSGDYATVSNRAMSALQSHQSLWPAVQASTNYTDAALGAFAETGTVERARNYGTPTRWTDATGCVWEVGLALGNPVSDTPGAVWDMYQYWPEDDLGKAYMRLNGVGWEQYVNLPDGWTNFTFTSSATRSDYTEDTLPYNITFVRRLEIPVTNLVGRVALTNDIPAIPAWAKAAQKPTYTASEVGATDADTVTNIVRDISRGGIWDADLEVWWTPVMRNGSLTYQATTNVNLNAEN